MTVLYSEAYFMSWEDFGREGTQSREIAYGQNLPTSPPPTTAEKELSSLLPDRIRGYKMTQNRGLKSRFFVYVKICRIFLIKINVLFE